MNNRIFITDSIYTKASIYEILSVPIEKQKGAWGYRI